MSRNHNSTALAILANAAKEHPNDIFGQTHFFYERMVIMSDRGRPRPVSTETKKKYLVATRSFLATLHNKGIKVRNLSELTYKHVQIVFGVWESSDMSSSALGTYFTNIKRFYAWQAKPFPVRSVREILKDKDRAKRSYSATRPMSWAAKGIDVAQIITRIEKEDPFVGMCMLLMKAFGLRIKEAAAIHPAKSDKGDYLVVHLGTKGGRGRMVPINSEFRRQALDKALAFANPVNGYLRHQDRTVRQAERRIHYICEKYGITRKALGITPHHLRHEFTHDRYNELTGTVAPVLGGERPQQELDKKARLEVSENLGHSRLSITAAYTGTAVHMKRAEQRQAQQLITRIRGCLPIGQAFEQCREAFLQRNPQYSASQIETRMWVLGAEAQGKPNMGYPLTIGVDVHLLNGAVLSPSFELSDLSQLMAVFTQQFARVAVVVNNSCMPAEAERLEIYW